MVNTYIIVPTIDDYSMSLGAATTLCGAIFHSWSNKSLMKPILCSNMVLLVENTLYVLAYDFKSIYLLIVGHLFCGIGMSRVVNRRKITDCVPLHLRMKASVCSSASALGMACCLVVAYLFQTKFKFLNITFN
uniref:Uncharacterized protein n=1 Tax=Solanum lycopersicum TaxID=4081 RepID=A0A3Q7EZQ3_SOLLC